MEKLSYTVRNQFGTVVPGASVTVYNYGTQVKASIYSDNSDVPAAAGNPLTADALGYCEFYAANGRYTLSISGSSFDAALDADIILHDPADDIGVIAVGTVPAAGTSCNIDFSTAKESTHIVLDQPACALTFSNVTAAAGFKREFELILEQGTGANLVSAWPTQVTHANGAPTLSIAASECDRFLVEIKPNGKALLTQLQSGFKLPT